MLVVPDVKAPLVCDFLIKHFYLLHLMCFEIWSHLMQVRKNIGPAGLTIVIIRDDDLLDQETKAEIPSILKYAS